MLTLDPGNVNDNTLPVRFLQIFLNEVVQPTGVLSGQLQVMKSNPAAYLPVVLKLLALLSLPNCVVPHNDGTVFRDVVVELIAR